jgi:hypothetical protein
MKKAIIIASIFLSIIACKKEIKDIGTPSSKVDGIQAKWGLTSCTMIDELSLVKEATSMGDFFTTKKAPNITFETVGGIKKYTVDTANVLVNFFQAPSGTWSFDNDEYPTMVKFIPDGGVEFSLPLGATVRTVDTFLKLRKPVYCGGELKFSYVLEFERK